MAVEIVYTVYRGIRGTAEIQGETIICVQILLNKIYAKLHWNMYNTVN